MRMAYVTPYDARDVRSWSGTGHYITRSLEASGAELQYVGPLKRQYHPVNVARYLWNTKVRGLADHPHRDPGFLRHYARQAERMIAARDAQVVFGPGGLPLAHLETDLPMVLWTDCTFASLLDYYGAFSNMSARSIRDGNAADQALFDRCDLAIFSCQWAADSAVADYGFPREKIELVSFGANVPDERTEDDVETFLGERPTDAVRLLFMGVDWVRKGGDIALEAARILHERGVDVELRCVGCGPPEGTAVPDYVKLLGFISKSTPEGVARINGLLQSSHFFLLPTRADCTPIVLCEAATFGLPAITTDTGGVASVVAEGRNGHCLPIEAGGEAYADAIERLAGDRAAYEALARSSFAEYRTRLNWAVAGRRIIECIQQHVGDRIG